MRENKLRQYTSFVDRLGSVDEAGDEVRSSKEARRLAFDIFWNARTDYSRSKLYPLPWVQSSHLRYIRSSSSPHLYCNFWTNTLGIDLERRGIAYVEARFIQGLHSL